MILPDLNLLVYAHNSAARAHADAHRWWSELLNQSQPVGLPWAVVFGFIRLTTHPGVLARPLPAATALAIVEGWFERDCVQTLDPGPRHLTIVGSIVAEVGVAGRLTTDIHLAALAMESQCELHSNDSDFQRISGLRWRNPLS